MTHTLMWRRAGWSVRQRCDGVICGDGKAEVVCNTVHFRYTAYSAVRTLRYHVIPYTVHTSNLHLLHVNDVMRIRYLSGRSLAQVTQILFWHDSENNMQGSGELENRNFMVCPGKFDFCPDIFLFPALFSTFSTWNRFKVITYLNKVG